MRPAAAARSPSSSPCSAPTSRGSSRRWRAIPSRSGCSIHRSTNSCPTPARRWRRSLRSWAWRRASCSGSWTRSWKRTRCSATEADFFSFGTNDLTQTTFGLSRDDAGRFLPFYVEHGILNEDPFQVLDQDGVGKLIEIAVRLGRGTRADLKIGICGEHGGEPRSVKFCHHVGMNYVSCSPFRIPIARLAAAQAALEEQGIVNRTKATV